MNDLVPQTTTFSEIVAFDENDARAKVLQDFETTRDNLIQTIADGQKTLSELMGLCEVTQSEKYYLAYSSLMKTVVDANEKLLAIQEKIRVIKARDEYGPQPKKVTNQIVMTSADLLSIIRKASDPKTN